MLDDGCLGCYWIVVYKSCDECGPCVATALFDHEPTNTEIAEVGREGEEFNFTRAICSSSFIAVVNPHQINSIVSAK